MDSPSRRLLRGHSSILPTSVPVEPQNYPSQQVRMLRSPYSIDDGDDGEDDEGDDSNDSDYIDNVTKNCEIRPAGPYSGSQEAQRTKLLLTPDRPKHLDVPVKVRLSMSEIQNLLGLSENDKRKLVKSIKDVYMNNPKILNFKRSSEASLSIWCGQMGKLLREALDKSLLERIELQNPKIAGYAVFRAAIIYKRIVAWATKKEARSLRPGQADRFPEAEADTTVEEYYEKEDIHGEDTTPRKDKMYGTGGNFEASVSAHSIDPVHQNRVLPAYLPGGPRNVKQEDIPKIPQGLQDNLPSDRGTYVSERLLRQIQESLHHPPPTPHHKTAQKPSRDSTHLGLLQIISNFFQGVVFFLLALWLLTQLWIFFVSFYNLRISSH
ncbi:hypothetical protein TWF281_006617 [Arthrobotrys megalospora]